MSIDSQLLNLTGGIKTSGHIKSNFGATIGVGTDAPTGIVEVQHSQPTLVVQQQATSGGSVTSYGKVHAASGTLHIQSGVDATSDSKGDIVLGSVGSGTKHVVVKGATSRVGIGSDAPAYGLDVVPESRFTGNVIASNISANAITLNELSLGVTQGLDNVVNVDNTTANTIAMSNVTDSTSTTTGALTVAGGIGVGGNVHCANLYASNITMNLVSFSGLQTFEQVVNNGRVLDSNVLIISNATPSTSSTTGALTLTAGGLGVEGNVYIGSNLSVTDETTLSNLTVTEETALANISVTGETVEVANLAVTSGSLELTQVANVFQVKSSANVVTEYVRSKKLIKYPRVAMTANSSGGYVASANSTYPGGSWEPYSAFNNVYVADGDGWEPQGGAQYSTSTGEWTGGTGGNTEMTLTNGVTIYGQWLQIQLPQKIKLSHAHFAPKVVIGGTYDDLGIHRCPASGYILGSNDGTSWAALTSWTGYTSSNFTESQFTPFNIIANDYYKYYRMVCTATVGGTYGEYFTVQELEYYGIPEYDPDAHGTDVIARSVPNVPNTDWLEVYYDGQDYTSMPSTITDKSGNSVTGTPSGVTFDSTWKAFTFNASSPSSIATSSITTSGGDLPHSWSVWIKPEDVSGSTKTYMSVFALGLLDGGGSNTMPGLTLARDQNRMQFGFNGNNLLFSAPFEFGKWVHVALTYAGGGATWSNRKLYLNGIACTPLSIIGTAANLNISTSASLDIGTTWYSVDYENYNGALASLRFHGRTLSSDEIWQLYAYQKDYFQVSPDVVTFKGGRLGIGTREPKAVLDVRGSIHANGHPAWPAPTAQFYKASGGTASQHYYENITHTGRIDFDNTVRETPDVIERYTWNMSTNTTTTNSTSGGIIKFCLPGTYYVNVGVSISKQSTHNKAFGMNFYRATDLGGSFTVGHNTHGPSYGNLTPDTQVNYAQHYRKQWMVHVTEAPAYGYPWVQPSANNGTYFRFETWADTPVAHVDIFYLG